MAESDKTSRQAVVAVLAVLSTAFSKEMPDEQIDIYMDALSDLSPDQLQRAVNIILAEERFFPSIAAIRQAATDDVSRLSPEEAWAFVCRRIQTGGRLAGAKGLSPEIVSGISACGGWVTLCQSENPTGDRITFVRAYKSFVERAKREPSSEGRPPEELRAALGAIGKGQP